MNGKWIAGMAIGLLLAANATPLFSQDITVAALRDRYAPAALKSGTRSPDPSAVLERTLAEGNRLLDQGKDGDALERFTLALTLASQAESHADLTYAMYRTGLAHRRIYDRSGDVMNLKAAIAYWEHERTLYIWNEYPEGFHALAGYDLGQAYLTLARHEKLVENSNRGLAILEQSLKTFGTSVASYQAALRPADPPQAVK